VALVPVFCDTCGTVFASDRILGGDMRVTLQRISIGPCPVCGGTGQVPDGVYDFIGDTIRVLNAPESSTEKLGRLAQIIEAGRTREAPAEQIVSELEEEAPELAPVIDVLVQQKPDPLRWLMLLLAIIGVLQRVGRHDISSDDIERLTHTVVEEIRQHPVTNPTDQPRHIRRQSERPRTGSARRPTEKRKKHGKAFGQKKRKKRRH
jgi:hypothetical protein